MMEPPRHKGTKEKQNRWVRRMRVVVEGSLSGAAERVRGERSGWIRALAGRVIAKVAGLTPVRTGRLRRGWFGGGSAVPSAGAELSETGTDGRGANVGGGGDGSEESVVRVEEQRSLTAVEVENRVPYVAFVEYGTRRMAARAMVRRALREARSGNDSMP